MANTNPIDVFIGDASCIWKATIPKEQSTCPCKPETGCDENCQNRYMLYECDSTNCKFGEELCGNRSFAELRRRNQTGRKYNIGVEVIKTESRGYGVRSNRTFEPNQIIVEYTGEVITQEECERRMKTLYKNNEVCFLSHAHLKLFLKHQPLITITKSVLLPHVLRPEHDYRCYPWLHCPVCQPFLRTKL